MGYFILFLRFLFVIFFVSVVAVAVAVAKLQLRASQVKINDLDSLLLLISNLPN